MALTLQWEEVRVFVSTKTAGDARQLARQTSLGEVWAALVTWAMADELAPELQQRAGGQGTAEAARADIARPRPGMAAQASAGAGDGADASPRPDHDRDAGVAASATGQDWLIAPWVDSSGPVPALPGERLRSNDRGNDAVCGPDKELRDIA